MSHVPSEIRELFGSSNTLTYAFTTITERQKFIIEHIKKQEPIVKLAVVGKHMSQLTMPPFRDITDLRIIQVVIAEVRTGRTGNGKEWCVLGVTDGVLFLKQSGQPDNPQEFIR